MQVYITQANLNKITSGYVKEDISGEVFKNVEIYFLSKYEKNNLLWKKEFYKNSSIEDSSNLIEIFNKIERYDTKTKVYEGSKPAFHSSEECNLMYSNMENFDIPESIQEENRQDEFRHWFKINNELRINNPDAFQARLYMKWGIKSLIGYHYDNSGYIDYYNQKIQDLEMEIHQMIVESEAYKYESDLRWKILDRFEKWTFLSQKDEKIKNNKFTVYNPLKNEIEVKDEHIKKELMHFNINFKKPIINKIKEYYKIKWNPKCTFKNTVLESIGFKKCSKCFNKRRLQ